MQFWRIINRVTGQVLGNFPGKTPEDALREWAREFGCESIEEALSALAMAHGDVLVEQVDTDVFHRSLDIELLERLEPWADDNQLSL
ncbi:MAG: hypothetical protein JXA57_09660 [Armatimonadetes bacterium]|nr:hypothetical protein [Armatimonadota bacterium]